MRGTGRKVVRGTAKLGVRQEFRLGAEREPHAVFRCDRRQIGEQAAFFLVPGIAPLEPVPVGRGAQVARGLAVDRRPRHHHLVHRPVQRRRQAGEIFAVPVRPRQRGVEDRIVAPYTGARPETPGDRAHLFDRPPGICHPALQRPRIAGDGELNDEGKAEAVDFGQRIHERPGVAGPEYKPLDVPAFQRLRQLGAAVRIAHAHHTGRQPGHEPIAVERRDVGSVGGGDDHRPAARGRSARTKSRFNTPFTFFRRSLRHISFLTISWFRTISGFRPISGLGRE